jgi:hypothetical protein
MKPSAMYIGGQGYSPMPNRAKTAAADWKNGCRLAEEGYVRELLNNWGLISEKSSISLPIRNQNNSNN